jgi:hypothetical protein
MSDGTTHYEGCWKSGAKHYECSVRELAACSEQFDRQQEMLDRNAEQIAILREQFAASKQEVEVQKAKADKHYELGTEYFDLMVKAEREIAALRDVLSRLIKVHDAMGGKCGTVRILAEEALLGKAQLEYICTCGIRVTPHKCPTDNDF